MGIKSKRDVCILPVLTANMWITNMYTHEDWTLQAEESRVQITKHHALRLNEEWRYPQNN